MKKNIFLVIFLMTIFMIANSQVRSYDVYHDGYRSLYIGFSPFGYSSIPVNVDEKGGSNVSYRYSPYFNVNVSKEGKIRGIGALFEASYSKAKFDKVKIDGGNSSVLDFSSVAKDLSIYDLTFYVGKTYHHKRQVQYPVFFGLGSEYLYGTPFHHLSFHLALKARVNIYFTNTLGAYVGGTYKIGLGGSGTLGQFFHHHSFLDVGLVYFVK